MTTNEIVYHIKQQTTLPGIVETMKEWNNNLTWKNDTDRIDTLKALRILQRTYTSLTHTTGNGME